MKIKGYRFPCEVCNNSIVCSVQVFFRKNGEISYARARHYGTDKKFYYHQQSIEYINKKLRELTSIDPCQGFDNNSIGQNKTDSSLKLDLMVGLPGFEPESIEPKSTSLDQASREPQRVAENIISQEP
jgi:hypothetical protein